nr:hypothetical protein [Paraflavitalea speifideiaquila]
MSIKWLIRYSRDRNGRSMAEKLANEVVAAAKGEGGAFKRKKILTVWLKPIRLSLTSKFNHFRYIIFEGHPKTGWLFYCTHFPTPPFG